MMDTRLRLSPGNTGENNTVLNGAYSDAVMTKIMRQCLQLSALTDFVIDFHNWQENEIEKCKRVCPVISIAKKGVSAWEAMKRIERSSKNSAISGR